MTLYQFNAIITLIIVMTLKEDVPLYSLIHTILWVESIVFILLACKEFVKKAKEDNIWMEKWK